MRTTLQIEIPNSIRDGFWENVSVGDPSSCWEWRSMLDKCGYGVVRKKKVAVMAHRVAFALSAKMERLPRELVCHRCDNPKCVNPAHLFLGTHTDNMRDMVAKGRHWNQKTHCKHGHEFTPENTYTHNGKRCCRTCNCRIVRERHLRRKK